MVEVDSAAAAAHVVSMETQQHTPSAAAKNAAAVYDDGINFFRGLAWGLIFTLPAWGVVVGGIALGTYALGVWH